MSASCCAQQAPRRVGSSLLRGPAPWLALLSASGVLLAPKCPLCLLAYCALFGLTLSASQILPLYYALVLLVPALLLASVLLRKRVERRSST
jgi:hypothetical protein